MAPRARQPAGLKLPDLRKAVSEGNFAPAYLLLGEEPALRRRAMECLRAPIEEDAGMPGAVVQLEGPKSTFGDIVDEARSLPLFGLMADGPARLVWVTQLEALDGQDAAELVSYLEDPVPATLLVFEAGKLDKRKALYKALSKGATLVDCAPPDSERDVTIWIEATLRNRGHAIEQDAVAYLLQMAGTRITVLEQELEKAMLHAGDGGRVTVAALEELMGRTREHSVFELTDALVRGDAQGAIRMLNMLLDDGEEPMRVLPMIAWICRQLILAKDLSTAARSRKEALEGIGGRWQQRGEILDRARRAARPDLQQTLVACAQTDIFIKGLRDTRSGADRLRPARGRLEALCRQICAA